VTGDELLAMGDVGPCELVEGSIVPRALAGAEQGGVVVRFGSVLERFVRDRGPGKVLAGKVGIYTRRNPDTVRGADVLFISSERHVRLRRPAGFLDVGPDLVVEVLSPEDRLSDLFQKLREYFAISVRLVWVADPAARVLLAYRSLTDVREFRETDRLPGDDVLPGFEVRVSELFEE
jgi:Uma2 family endonuclease